MINKDMLIRFPVPFLRERSVLYVDSSTGVHRNFIEESREEISDQFFDAGYTFTYLPDLVSELSPELLQYMFPGLKENVSVEDMYRHIRDLAGLGDKAGFLYKEWNELYFMELSSSSLEEFIVSLCNRKELLIETSEPEIGKIRSIRPHKGDETLLKESNDFFPSYEQSLIDSPDSDLQYFSRTDDVPLDAHTRAILEAWEEFERKFGVTIEDLEIILGFKVKLSPLHITRAGKIILTDFEGKEVKMDDLTKAVYFFFLQHPEGARLKELQDHEKEILGYYSGITGRDDIMKIRKSVHNLLDPFGNGLNISISRIKKAFKDIVGDRIAKYYYVDGRYAEPRKVAINRDLVIWEP